MPRKARIDGAGALHHILARGIEGRSLFKNDSDRERFWENLGAVLKETGTPCYAWVLMRNHVHLPLRTGRAPLTGVMRRVLTSKNRELSRARAVLCFLAVRMLRMSGVELARALGVDPSAISYAVSRGEKDTDAAGLEKQLLSASRSFRE